MWMSHCQNAGRNRNLKITNKFINKAEHFKYLRITVTNQTCIYEEKVRAD